MTANNAAADLTIATGQGPVKYAKCPFPSMRQNVLELLYENTFGDGVEDLDRAEIDSTRVHVTDFNNNQMPATLADVWDAIQLFFDDAAEEGPWCVDSDGNLTISKPTAKRSRTGEAKKTRQRADNVVKVTMLLRRHV